MAILDDDVSKGIVKWSAIGVGGTVLAVGGYFFVNGKIKAGRAARALEKAADPDSPEAHALAFKMAFANDGWGGTSEELVRRTFLKIAERDNPDSFYSKVIHAYKLASGGGSLIKKLEDELTAAEYSEMVNILAGVTPVTLARRMKAAFDWTMGPFWGTDLEAIKSVLAQVPSPGVWERVKDAYRMEYSRDLMTDLWDELSFGEEREIRELLKSKDQR